MIKRFIQHSKCQDLKHSTKEDNNKIRFKNLTKDRKIKLDKIIKASGFKEIYIYTKWIYLMLHLIIKMKLFIRNC